METYVAEHQVAGFATPKAQGVAATRICPSQSALFAAGRKFSPSRKAEKALAFSEGREGTRQGQQCCRAAACHQDRGEHSAPVEAVCLKCLGSPVNEAAATRRRPCWLAAAGSAQAGIRSAGEAAQRAACGEDEEVPACDDWMPGDTLPAADGLRCVVDAEEVPEKYSLAGILRQEVLLPVRYASAPERA
jgi:hypothetical protein